MRIDLVDNLGPEPVVPADIVIVGGGPAGLTIARECAAEGRRVLVLESGALKEDEAHEALNRVESVGAPHDAAQIAKRRVYHSINTQLWTHDVQPFGVRCRALGGSTNAWAGKSAPFSAIDYEKRDWVELSGWPITGEEIAPYVLRAITALDLCPADPKERFRSDDLYSFFWQFARSRVNHVDAMRFGEEFQRERHLDVQVLLDATVTRVSLSKDGARFAGLDVASTSGRRIRVEAPLCVLAASSIENTRLLMASNDVLPEGIGNGSGQLGRYLMDHVGCEIAEVAEADFARVWRRFGFVTVGHGAKSHLFMHGLALTPQAQAREKLMHAALYFVPLLADDDPWPAVKRLLTRKSSNMLADVMCLVRGARYLFAGVGMQLLARPAFPAAIRKLIVNLAIRFNPNFVAEEFLAQGLPRKIKGVGVEAICEQAPNPESRIALSDTVDGFGVPLARVDWRINPIERDTLIRLAKLAQQALADAGLGQLNLADWVADEAPERAVIIDMAHTMGATRMSLSPQDGVVDTDCQVHGVSGLYVAGGSVFPTCGHANPTLMIVALAIRLADHLNLRLRKS
ncbi:MAG TPA: GMC family oxidoreductase [Caulobacteraceae bacterium]|nr:GMC family oxidoreductase [Caulobacteraceae bacterium]